MIYSIDSEKQQMLTAKIGNKIYYGCSQKWYPSFIQRLAGCGPTAASNLFACINNPPFANKAQRLVVMQDLWLYVTPGIYGLDSVDDFAGGSNRFFKDKDLPYECVSLKYPDDEKPPFDAVKEFLKTALSDNCPVAFMNLSNGAIEELEQWHWVTVVSFDDQTNAITVFDANKKFEMDLKLWHDTTTRRAGFARFKNK